MGAIVEVEKVSKFYGNVLGLNEISLSFRGGITGILGPNGAGKSTLLKIITGQIRPEIGNVSVLGMKVWDNPGLYRHIGYCPEQETFYDNMTGLKFVTFCARLSGMDRSTAEREARRVLKIVDLTRDMNRNVGGYSKGMKQRTKIAQSLVHDPSILVLDEPLAGTDPLGRYGLMELIFKLRDQGKHILISSHVLHEVERMTEEIVLINKGKLVAQGNIHSIRDRMDRYPLTVRLVTKNRRSLARELSVNPLVTTLTYDKDPMTLLVKTRDPSKFYGDLQDLIVNSGIPVTSLDSPDDNLESIFKYLVE